MFLKNVVKEKKKASGLSISEISKKSGLKGHYISKLLYDNIDRPSSETLDKLAKAFECESSEFVSEDDITDVNLFRKVTSFYEEEANQRNISLSREKKHDAILKIYSYAKIKKEQKKSPYIDESFSKWFFEKYLET
ncbi:MAG: helix-turn-helix transcriptional regulator [Proteobacteria bacterium]|nr:helix-turn-helix transcriptional regulator [Pseudomonadota bacterium]